MVCNCSCMADIPGIPASQMAEMPFLQEQKTANCISFETAARDWVEHLQGTPHKPLHRCHPAPRGLC